MADSFDVSVAEPQTPLPRPEDASKLEHHAKAGVGFVNPWASYLERPGWQIAKAMIWRRLSGTANLPNTEPPTVPVHKPTFLPSRATPALRATWLGHACFLVEFPSGFRALFDPVFTERCSPFSWLGPKRYTKIPCQIDEIPLVDAVIISHNHYDHMSHPTMTKIKDLFPKAHFFVPLGNKQWCLDSGLNNVTELDWWQERNLTLTNQGSSETEGPKEITAQISALPCQHTSARGPFDKAKTLWSSWSVSSGGKKVWFGGDTGYRSVPELPKEVDDYGPEQDHPHCPAFKEIGRLRGPFDLGLIPIGAYDPRWIMSPMHANPFDSVNIFADTGCRRALGIHWGTWVLTEEDVLEPPRKLKEALTWKGLAQTGVFDVCDIGESVDF
ncbi:MAG: hypothetical protein M1814_004938 [Vezdaea aestivalis]|nr:MAG: hypothetical protein M1814_004938 [Vezdaea aestivalis]